MKTFALEYLVKQKALLYKIDWTWMTAIISHESSWDIYAMRYEDKYSYLFQVDVCAKIANVSFETETICQKSSFGLAQLMGGLAREQGLKGSILQLTDPNVNIEHLAIRLQHLLKLSQDRDSVFAMYNGGPGALNNKFQGLFRNQAYVDAVNGFWKTALPL